jgi:hypothetical protein
VASTRSKPTRNLSPLIPLRSQLRTRTRALRNHMLILAKHKVDFILLLRKIQAHKETLNYQNHQVLRLAKIWSKHTRNCSPLIPLGFQWSSTTQVLRTQMLILAKHKVDFILLLRKIQAHKETLNYQNHQVLRLAKIWSKHTRNCSPLIPLGFQWSSTTQALRTHILILAKHKVDFILLLRKIQAHKETLN